MRVYYLSEAQYALSNVALRRIKIARIADLNDPFELLAVNLRNRAHRQAVRRWKEELSEQRGLLCYSKSWGQPMLWSHYADKHRGICLGFDVPDKLLMPVEYLDKPLTLKIDWSSGWAKVSPDLVNRLLRAKSKGWNYEDEVRLFIKLDPASARSGLYFLDFSKNLVLREIILGLRCEFPITRVRDIVSTFSPTVYVSQARLAFGKFDIVENRAMRRKVVLQ
jgi:hypothetical protein